MVKIEQKLELKQQLTPQQVLQASILQLNVAVLEQRILQELEENPVLELAELENEFDQEEEKPEVDEDEKAVEIDEKSTEEPDFDWEEILGDPDEYEYRPQREKYEEEYTPVLVSKQSFSESLMEQFQDLNPTEIDIEIAEQLIGNIDDDGYLTVDVLLIADRFGATEEKVVNILKKIQTLDPPGMGARDLRECLLAQLEYNECDELEIALIRDHFDDFANHRYEKIMASVDCTRDELHEAMEVIALLNPRPGSSMAESDKDYVIPDIIMERDGEEWIISINDTTLPALRINKQYINLLTRHKDNADVKQFVSKKLESGKWFLDAIKQRQNTMMNVMRAIVEKQDIFFSDSDDLGLKPMVLKDIAEEVRMDISTISRVTNGKFVQ
nr:RNA polymerase factor sigma-54 [FCB group bacterium]